MAVSKYNYYNVQSKASDKATQLQKYKDNNANPIGIIQQQPETKYYEYYPQQLCQQDQQRQRSVSSKQEDKITSLYLQPNPISINQKNLYYSNLEQQLQMQLNQDYNSYWNNNIKSNNRQNANKIFSLNSKNQSLGLQDQIDIAINQQKLNSLSKQQQFDIDIEKRQKFDSGYSEFFLSDIKNQSNMIQLQNSRPPSEQQAEKEDSLNCTQASFMKTQSSACHSCKQDIYEKKINLVCWHNYHSECILEIINSQMQFTNVKNLPKCLCGLKIKQKIIYQLPNGKQLIETLMKKQLDIIYKNYQNYLKKCPNCKFRFIQDYRLKKTCYCENCRSEFKIQ